MVEYIDKELAVEGMWAGLKEGTICGPEDTETFLRSLPAADVETVRHGRWIEDGDFVVCPVCGRRWNVFDNDTDTFDRCPHCGAHIDGEVNQDG